MNKQYIFRPKIDLDILKIKEIVFRNLHKSYPELATHQRYVREEPYLVGLREKYPFFSQLYNIYPTPPNCIVPIHICPDRGCALNIPIQYTEDSYTVFYESKDNKDIVMTYNVPRIYHVIESEMVEVYRYTLIEPVVMNTLLPHGVFGGPKTTRIIMSWSITSDYDYEKTKSLIG